MSILITTYEGTHNHPLPLSATTMASTTSAAASMLISGSSSSSSKQFPTTTSMAAPPPPPPHNLLQLLKFTGLNFYLSHDHHHPPSNSNPFYLQNSSSSSSSSPYQTITLDLTSSSSPSSHFLKAISPNYPPNISQRHSSANLSFNSLESNPLPITWSNSVLNYATTQPFSKNLNNSLDFGGRSQPQENYYQPFMQKGSTPCNNPSTLQHQYQQTLAPQDSIAAVTKAITSDPSFQAALTAALASLIGGRGNGGDGGGGDKSGHNNLKLGEPPFSLVTSLSSTSSTANKCSESYLNRSPTTPSTQAASLMFMQPPLPFSTSMSKSSSSSPGDNTRDQIS